MKKSKLLTPLILISAIATVATPLTSCNGGSGGGGSSSSITPKFNVTHGTYTYTTVMLNTGFNIFFTPDSNYEFSSVTITIGGTPLVKGTGYLLTVGDTITTISVQGPYVTSSTIVITIVATEKEGSATKVITSDTTLTEGTFASSSADANAVLVNGKNITAKLSGLTLNKTGDCSETKASSFYGTNSALLAKGGSNTILDNLNVTTNASGANGVFAYGGTSSTKSGESGDGTNITISNSTISTSKGNSGGIMVAGHASLTATDCTVTTQGNSSAAIRSDRGGDTMNVYGGSYTSSGAGSPAIYATATITVGSSSNGNTTLTSTHSEGVIVEGSNFVTLTNCNLEDKNDQINGQSTSYKNIFLYQSVSGDAGTGSDGITINGGTMMTHQGDDFYVTNQTSTINLNGVTITNDSPVSPSLEIPITNYFLRAKADAWGKTGQNGGNVTLNFDGQTATGDIYIDDISTLAWTLKNNSTYEGTINGDNTAKTLTISATSGCSIKLTGDSYVTATPDATTLACIDVGEYHLYLDDGTELK